MPEFDLNTKQLKLVPSYDMRLSWGFLVMSIEIVKNFKKGACRNLPV